MAAAGTAGRCSTYVIDERPGHVEPIRAEVAHDAALESRRAVRVEASVALRRLREQQQVEVAFVRCVLCGRELSSAMITGCDG